MTRQFLSRGAAAGLLLFTAGCGTMRRTTSTQTQTERDTAIELRTERVELRARQTETFAEHHREKEVLTEIIEYDTSQGADSTTGLPPIKRKIRQVEHETGQRNKMVQARTEKTITEQADTLLTATERTAAATSESIRRGPGPLQQLLCAVGIAALALLAWQLAGKRFRRL